MTSELLTVEEVAQRLKLNPQTVRRWIRRGTLPATKIGRKEWRIRAADVYDCLAEPAPAQALGRTAAVARIIALRERLRGRGISLAELMGESRRELERRGAARRR